MKKILVTGSKGQLGTEIRQLAVHYPDFSFVFTDVDELDLTLQKTVDDFLGKNTFDFCINCAAYTAVDKAEDDRETARLINVTATEYLTQACAKNNTFLVHISTDYVFNGKNYRPYTETDRPSPDSYYGQTKLQGEASVMRNTQKGLIIRTSWLYSAYGNNFVKTMLRLGKERPGLGVVVDQVGTPTWAGDLARAILEILSKNTFQSNKVEIYHYSNEGAISWYDFARAIMHYAGLTCQIDAIASKDFPAKAPRPFYSVLDKTKIKQSFGIKVPYWLDSLKTVLKQLKEG